MVTDSYNGAFRLRETTRGQGIRTFNMQKGTSYGNAVDFTDADNFWNNVNANKDQYATDAHWGAEMTYDYYQSNGRNSIDGNGYQLNLYVHYNNNYVNAFWDGTRMTFGDGNANYSPLTTLDVTGHEISHGLDEHTANLAYQGESGALNESFSDIFGACVERFADSTTANWLIGEDLGNPFRSMSDPNAYGDPDTYFGTNWYSGTGDYGGVHTNSGVQNHWFYRLSVGGSGTNDIGNNFNVTGIGIQKAQQIAWRNMVYYLTNSSDYADARFYSIQAANPKPSALPKHGMR
jgi:Zn-dependent metalloprotease